ncbi:hypothetical protein B0H12DRAFT_1238473 [Mycena haematopus]|nr:hypothetical protein B0H12DRAFT_1238473 [Mycena haematopus]
MSAASTYDVPGGGNPFLGPHRPESIVQHTHDDCNNDPPTDSHNNGQPSAPPERTVQDAVATRDILLEHFPPELVYIILHHAEYWAEVKVLRAEEIRVTASSRPLSYLETPGIVDHQRFESDDIYLKVARVAFRIVSHDQGWCTDQSLEGTYRGHTWFEAAILRSNEADLTMAHEVHNAAAVDGGTRWAVQRNFCASRVFREHVIAWDADPTSTLGIGAGDGTGFVASLVPGDRINVIAKALHPGWANWIQSVQVSIYYGLA